jgi:dCMP deaminase
MNHTEAQMNRWDARFLGLAHEVARWSKDPSTKVGAVIVDDQRRVLALGYNGFPRGVNDDPDLLRDRNAKYARVVHAELNAILNAAAPSLLTGATIYITHQPCSECAKAIIQSGIRTVVTNAQGLARWGDSQLVAWEMFDEAGVQTR